jgi:integrase
MGSLIEWSREDGMMDLRENFDLKKVGGHLPRQRYQRGSLKAYVPAGKGKPKRPLPRGTYWARWYRYVRQTDGREKRSPREKIITKELASSLRIGTEYEGPLTKADAQRVLDLLIARDAGTYTAPDTAATFVKVAREYLAVAEPGWGPHTVRTSKGLIESVLIGGRLGNRPVIELTEIELQQFLNEHVAAGASRSKLSKILLYMRNILDHAVMKKILAANPARNPGYRLKAKSRRQVSERYLSFDECRRLLLVVSGGDHLAIRILIQLGLRSEELFALRRDDVLGDVLRIDEALVDGTLAPVKTDASDASVYVPPDLQVELQGWLEWLGPDPRGWLFPASKGGPWSAQNYLNRVLKPAAVRAGVGVFKRQSRKGALVESTDVNFQVLRRTCATLFGAKAKDPRDTQAQLRHADPTVTLRHYQKSIPASVRAAALAFEEELIGSSANRSEQVLNRSTLDDSLEVLENYGATRRDRTGDLLITKFRVRAYAIDSAFGLCPVCR